MAEKPVWPIFWALMGVFVVVVCLFTIPPAREAVMGLLFMVVAGVVLLVLGALLLVFTVRQKRRSMIRGFLLLTGAATVGIPVCAVLHNAVYGLFIYWFGAGFWNGGDEPFFFIMATIVCPLGFIVGVVGSLVLAVRQRRVAAP